MSGTIAALRLPIGYCFSESDPNRLRTAEEQLELLSGGRALVLPARDCEDFEPTLTVFAGWILTAFALSLGAPFWFDLLSKLVSIKGAGSVPKTGSEETPQPKDGAGPGPMMIQGTPAPERVVPRGIDDIPTRSELESGETARVSGTQRPLTDELRPETSALPKTPWERENLSPDDVRDIQRIVEVGGDGFIDGRLDSADTRQAIATFLASELNIEDANGQLNSRRVLQIFNRG